ncbi:MAG: ubiquitin-like small modifier protein 1 [Bacillota bacterium]
MLIKLFASFRQPGLSDRVPVEIISGATVMDALEVLFAERPFLRPEVMAPGRRELQPHVNIMLKGRLIRDLQGLGTPLSDGDTLSLFPPSAGG